MAAASSRCSVTLTQFPGRIGVVKLSALWVSSTCTHRLYSMLRILIRYVLPVSLLSLTAIRAAATTSPATPSQSEVGAGNTASMPGPGNTPFMVGGLYLEIRNNSGTIAVVH